jgi:DNA-binding XRE family transcriptional regulator
LLEQRVKRLREDELLRQRDMWRVVGAEQQAL